MKITNESSEPIRIIPWGGPASMSQGERFYFIGDMQIVLTKTQTLRVKENGDLVVTMEDKNETVTILSGSLGSRH